MPESQIRPLHQLVKWAKPVFANKAIRNLVEGGFSPTKVKEIIVALSDDEKLGQRGRWLSLI